MAHQKLPPAWLINAINEFRTLLLRLNRSLFPGNVVLYEQLQNFWLLPSLYVAAKLDIATLLKNKPLTAAEISEQLKIDEGNISRIMRALASQGIFKQTRKGAFTINAMAMGLLNEQGSLRYMILHHLGPVNWNLMSNLEYSVRTGQDAFADKYHQPVYEYLSDHPGESALFDKSMSNLSDLGLAPILHAYDFSKFATIADIGGGEGFLLANILNLHPGLKGILFDIPRAMAQAPAMLTNYAVADRTEVIPGDFFSSIPAGADLYILKNVLHNWDDEQSVDLIKKIGEACQPGVYLLIIEMVVPTGNKPSLAKLLDIQMMATMPGGKERTAEEYRRILEKSGFAIKRIIPTVSPICLIEAVKIG